MSGDTDPMLGSDEERAAYVNKITAMIAQDVEQRRAQRQAEFRASQEGKAVIVGVTGANSLIGALDSNTAE